MKLKVCGMKNAENIEGLAKLRPEWMGLIFYPKSPRYPENLVPEDIQLIDIQKVGVFVKEEMNVVLETVEKWGLDYVQLHGDETVKEVKALKEAGLKVIKVFRVSDRLPDNLAEFTPYVDFFLFDTKKTEAFGGTGAQFDWTILKEYNSKVPFLLSGGINLEDIDKIKSMELTQCVGLDINSKVEIEPGQKDLKRVQEIIERL